MPEQQLPTHWPASVHPPEAESFQRTALEWLFDQVPGDYRLHGVFRRYPVALALLARYHVASCLEGARQGYRSARVELSGLLPAHAVERVMAAYSAEGSRLAATMRAIELVEDALRDAAATTDSEAGDP